SRRKTGFSHGGNDFLAAFQTRVIVGFRYIKNGSRGYFVHSTLAGSKDDTGKTNGYSSTKSCPTLKIHGFVRMHATE
ncbi:MAG: hypothetical protein WAO51_07900, partial [Bacillota bacterium]